MIILDTNVVSAMTRDGPDTPLVRDWLNRQPRSAIWTTSITVLELRFGVATMALGRARSGIELRTERLLREYLQGRIAPFDSAAAEATAALMAERRRAGRTGELRDSMIAGIAIARHAVLATRNTRHFADLPVAVVDPWSA